MNLFLDIIKMWVSVRMEKSINRKHLHYQVWTWSTAKWIFVFWLVYKFWQNFPLLFYFIVTFFVIAFAAVWQMSLAPRYRSKHTREIMEPIRQQFLQAEEEMTPVKENE